MSSLLSLDDTLSSRITDFIREDKRSLCSLCVVNKSISAIASGVLYSKISVSSRSDVDVLRDLCNAEAFKGDGPISCLTSSCLPRNASHVKELEVTAMMLPGPNQEEIIHTLEFVLSKYTNLLCFRWQPSFCETELAVGVARLLPRLSGLRSLSFRVPFALPPIPKASSVAKPASNLDAITEEDENVDQEEGNSASVVALPSQSEIEYAPFSDDREEENVPSYEYKPFGEDPIYPFPTQPTPSYSIPPKEMRHLQALTLTSATNDVLTGLPETLSTLEIPIQSLCFQGNCGPVTPGTLTSLLPVLQEAQHFGLGLSYSIKYDELIPFLDGLPKLRRLEVFHYHQLYALISPFAHLRSLKYIKVRHAHTDSRIQVINMCVWMRRLISASPLEELDMVCENSDPQPCPLRGPGHGIRYDGLIEHILARHRETLRILKMPGAYLGIRSLRKLFGKDEGCEALEELDVSLRRQAFASLGEFLDSAHRMRTICLNVVNLRRGTTLTVDDGILKDGKTSLRSVTVNGQGYMGEWTVDLDQGSPMQSGKTRLKAVFRISQVAEGRASW